MVPGTFGQEYDMQAPMLGHNQNGGAMVPGTFRQEYDMQTPMLEHY